MSYPAKLLSILSIFSLTFFLGQAQMKNNQELFPGQNEFQDELRADAGKDISVIENELKEMATQILNGTETDEKFELNKKFITKLMEALSREDSYEYAWDSLNTISRLQPEDNSFRIFTWYIVDEPKNAYYATLAHYYFGLVQRKYITQKGETKYLVIPLMEIDRMPRNIETMRLDNRTWLGALYYQPKYMDHLMAMDGYFYKLLPKDKAEMVVDKKEKQEIVEFIPGRFKARRVSETNRMYLSTHTRVKEKSRYYMLMGWNGWDNKSNYKFLEVMSFDPEDSMKVNFGAPIIYYEKFQPLSRGIFKYSEYAPFSMNTGYVKSGLFNMGKKMMIIYDHLATPNQSNANEQVWDLGPDGSYDALSYHKRLGVFQWHRDVEIWSEYNKDYNNRTIKKQIKIQKKAEEERVKKWQDATGAQGSE
ncbi:MAG: hypothetical protein H6581_00950 [Bacteroidia bacterium]|nr:hypothetical protein [Bacteroidia bacterium]